MSLYQLVLGSLYQQVTVPFSSAGPLGHYLSQYLVIMPKMLDTVRESLKMTGEINDVAFLQLIQVERREKYQWPNIQTKNILSVLLYHIKGELF